jgi:hypothetical protein
VSVGERQVGQLCAASFRDPKRVEGEQAGECVVVAAGHASLDEERTELGPVESEPGGLLGDLRPADMDGRGVFEELLLDAVAVEPGEHDQLQCDRGRSETSGFETAGVQLHVRAADIRQGLELVLFSPVEPQPQLGGIGLPGPWGRVAGDERDCGPAGLVLFTGDGQDEGGCGHGRIFLCCAARSAREQRPPVVPSGQP